MVHLRRRRHTGNAAFAEFYEKSHAPAALDEKTKRLMHLAVVLALKCEPCAVNTFTKLREETDASEEEIRETVQLAGSVGAGALLAMAERADVASQAGHTWWQPDTRP